MIDPELTNVLRRRIWAFLIDLGTILVGTAIVWRTQLIAFPITARDMISDLPIFDANQQERLDEIAQNINTSFIFRETQYVLDRSGFILTGIFAVLLVLITTVLLPANTGWSLGKKLTGLRVVSQEGERPSIVAFLVRSIAGIVDLVPFVVPGLLGWLLARADDFHRRIGDRVAGTVVVPASAPLQFIDPEVHARRNELRRIAERSDAVHDLDSMVQIDDRLNLPPLPSVAPRPVDEPLQPATQPTATQPAAAAAAPSPYAAPAPVAAPVPEVATVDIGRADDRPATTVATPPSNVGTSADPAPDWLPPATAAAPAPRVPTPAPKPSHRRASAPADDNWERPTPQPAPVWQPGAPVADTAKHLPSVDAWPDDDPIVAPEPARAPWPTDVEPVVIDDRQHSWSDAVASSSDQPASAESSTLTESAPPTQSSPLTGPDGTVWNEQWQAWLFWDPINERWLRHDTDADRWVPIG